MNKKSYFIVWMCLSFFWEGHAMVPLAISIQEVFSILKRGNALPPEGILLASALTKYPEVPARQR